jgi:hypothetical protein
MNVIQKLLQDIYLFTNSDYKICKLFVSCADKKYSQTKIRGHRVGTSFSTSLEFQNAAEKVLKYVQKVAEVEKELLEQLAQEKTKVIRKVEIDLYPALDVILVAKTDYRVDNFVFFFLWSAIGKTLLDEEIEEYAQAFLSESAKSNGYTEEDCNNAKETLIKFREEMQKNG